jgi:hypothetical protein
MPTHEAWPHPAIVLGSKLVNVAEFLFRNKG